MNQLLSLFAATPLIATIALSGTGFRHKADSENFTEPAGREGEMTRDIPTTSEYFGVQALTIWQYDRRPCSLQMEQASLNARSTGLLESVKVCEPTHSEQWRRADVGAGHFVTAVSVCFAAERERGSQINGVQLWSATIDSKGRLYPAAKSVSLEFDNCERWTMRRACPQGQIATGFRAHSDGEQGVVGLSLRCHEIESFASPDQDS